MRIRRRTRVRLARAFTLFAALLCQGNTAGAAPIDAPSAEPTVVLLHGLARSASSMQRMEAALQKAGYRVCNIDYPSREHAIAELASQFVAPGIAQCVQDPDTPVSFVTHSLGGIIVRELARAGLIRSIHRVVMLGPPNRGSEVVDALGDLSVFDTINGPAGKELGTSADSVPRQLGPADFEVGVIAGSRSINWINSLMIPGVDDGKVSIEHTKLEGMRDFIVVESSHPFLMKDDDVIEQTLQFLATGCFARNEEQTRADVDPVCAAADQ
jgi:triacylglycerol lipase